MELSPKKPAAPKVELLRRPSLARSKSLAPINEADSENSSSDSLEKSFESWELIGASSSDEEIKKKGRRLYKEDLGEIDLGLGEEVVELPSSDDDSDGANGLDEF